MRRCCHAYHSGCYTHGTATAMHGGTAAAQTGPLPPQLPPPQQQQQRGLTHKRAALPQLQALCQAVM
jgi:hypothetical protein